MYAPSAAGQASVESTDDAELVGALRDGDEDAFRELMDAYDSVLVRVATIHVGSRAVAEEVVRETWLAVIGGLEGFDGRRSLRTWILRTLTAIASRRGRREGRTAADGPLAAADERGVIRSAIEALPADQRTVLTLRDMERWPAADACAALGIGALEQRALLHRARTSVHGARERHFDAMQESV